MTRTLFVIGFTVGAVALGLACTADNTTSPSGSSSGSTSSSGATSSGGTTSSSGASGSSAFKDCSKSTSGASKCTDAEYKPFTDCFEEKCGPTYAECYGADYKSGKFAGPCGDYITCTQKCECGDTNCLIACKPSTECTSCNQKLGTCGSSCTLPACAMAGTSSGDAGGGAGCTELKACCDKMTDANFKTSCNQVASTGNAAACSASLPTYTTYCP